MSRGTRHPQRDGARYFCLTTSNLNTLVRSAQKPAPPRSRRLPADAVGSTSLSMMQRQTSNHRDAREVQRTPSQHDNLACVPRARSCEGCHRRSTAARHRRHPIARCANRVVSPTSNARSDWLMSLPVSLPNDAPGTGLKAAETKGQKEPAQYNAPSQRPIAIPQSPPIRGNSRLFQERSANARLGGGPGRTRTSNQTVMSEPPAPEAHRQLASAYPRCGMATAGFADRYTPRCTE
jgi:hypothetical protein